MTTRPRVVCVCGSMRFEQDMRAAAVTESLAGHIVLLPLVNMRTPDPRWADPATAEQIKADLDRLHLAKIDTADEVLIVCPGGYIGTSTGREIDYARQRGLPVRFTPDTWTPDEQVDVLCDTTWNADHHGHPHDPGNNHDDTEGGAPV